jgi:hypothetical protein
MDRKSLANTVGSLTRNAFLVLVCALLVIPGTALAALPLLTAAPTSDEREESDQGKETSAADPRANRSTTPGAARHAREYLPAPVAADSARFGHPATSRHLPPALTDALRNGLGAPLLC